MSEDAAPAQGRESLNLNAWCVGAFPLVSFSTIISLLLPYSGVAVDGMLASMLPISARVLTFFALAVFASRIVSILRRPRLLLGAACLMMLGAAGIVVSYMASVPLAFLLVAEVVAEAGYAVLYIGWVELYSQMDTRHVLVYFTLVHLLSALLSYGVFLAGTMPVTAAVVVAIPAAALAMLRRADKQTADALYRQGEVQRLDWSLSPRPVVLLAAFGFANVVIRSFLGTEGRAAVLLGVCAAAICVLAIAFARRGLFEVKSLYQASVPVLVAGALLVLLESSWSGIAAALCSNAAYTLFSIFVTVTFCAATYRYGVNAVWLFGATQASLSLGTTLGRALTKTDGLFLLEPEYLTITMSVLVVALVALSMALVSDRDLSTMWGIAERPGADESRTAIDDEEALGETCRRVAQRFGLTRREEEVLVLMMRGYTLPRIGEELYVAESTMKTHSRHIYRKVGVSNRKELQEFVEAYPGKRR